MTPDAETRTYRGKTLEELIPRIREELGPDAVIVRQRDGLQGGVGGFFQKQFVEVEAQASSPDSAHFDAYDDDAAPARPPGGRFTPSAVPPPPRMDAADARREGLEAPAIQAVVEQAAPFSDPPERVAPSAPSEAGLASGPYAATAFFEALRAAQTAEADAATMQRLECEYGPEIRIADAPAGTAAPAATEHPAAFEPLIPAPEPGSDRALQHPTEPGSGLAIEHRAPAAPTAEPEAAAARARPAAAAGLERTLADAGLRAAVATALVDDAVSHLLPFASPRRLKALVRLALAERIPVLPTPSGARRVVAFVGAGGAGKTLCTARLAAAYAAGSDLPVTCVALRQRDDGALLRTLLDGTGVAVASASSAAEARTRAGAHPRGLVVLDTPTVSPHDDGAVRALAGDLAALGDPEVHLTVPATLSAPAARELVEGSAPLGITALALTHADETAHVGQVVDLAMRTDLPLSYVGRGTAVPGGLAPADPHEIAARVLP